MNATRGLRASTIAVLLALTPASVFAADMAVRKAPPPPPQFMPPPVYNWTGFYLGGNLGGVWESSTITDQLLGPLGSVNRSGFIGGGQVGYNWQFAPWGVIGAEWMFDGSSLNSSVSSVDSFGDLFQANERVDYVTTVAGRLGFAANNWLFYGKGGGGWVRDRLSVASLDDGTFFNTSQTRGGWLAGAGVEYGISQNWTIGVDWSHIGFDDQTVAGFGGFGFVPDEAVLSRHFDIVTGRLNFKF